MKVGYFKMEKIGLKTKNKQLVKEITQQDIHELNDLVEQLGSWMNVLEIMNDYFSENKMPLNKKEIARRYYASSQVYCAFHDDYLSIFKRLEENIVDLKGRRNV